MLIAEFKKYDIENFTPKEVQATGSDLRDVKVFTLVALQRFRTYLRRPVKLFPNGITTGKHKAAAHKEGYAVDFFILPEHGPINIHQIYKGCLHAHFKAFGIYWNQMLYSFHGEIDNPYRTDYARWLGVKDEANGVLDWQWFSFLRDPKKIIL